MNRWHNNYFPDYALKQVTELVTKYPVDIVWFDGIGLKTRQKWHCSIQLFMLTDLIV